MSDVIRVALVGVQGPPGPGSVDPGDVITTRGALIVGDAGADPAALLIGPSGRYLRSNGTDPSWSAIAAADLPTGIDTAKLGGGTVSNAELARLAGVTSPLQTQLDGKASSEHAHVSAASRGIVVARAAQSLATPSDNTASTAVYAIGMELAFDLPAGTWRVHAIGGIALRHSAGGTVRYRVAINDQDSTARTFSDPSATLYTPLIDDDVATGLVEGSYHVQCQFRSETAGTTYAKQPWVLLIAERTA